MPDSGNHKLVVDLESLFQRADDVVATSVIGRPKHGSGYVPRVNAKNPAQCRGDGLASLAGAASLQSHQWTSHSAHAGEEEIRFRIVKVAQQHTEPAGFARAP
jgi:hypothetical protein